MTGQSRAPATPWLLVLAGRPGTGKTTLAKGAVRATQACYLRVDVVETALLRTREDVGADGYIVTHGLVLSNLLLGNNVLVDAVNAVPEARAGWDETAGEAGARLVVVETTLPNLEEHRRRVQTRQPDIAGHAVPTWEEVQGETWVPWYESRDGARHLVDTTDAETALQQVLELLHSC